MKRALFLAAALIGSPLSAQVQNGPRMGLDGSIHAPNASYYINGTSGAAAFGSATVGSLTANAVTLGAGASASLYKQLPSTCSNILAYGGDKTGAADNSTAFNAAIAASPAGQACIYLPAGTYKFTSTPTVTLASSLSRASLTIKGDSAEGTQIVMASGVSGPTINATAAQQSVHIRDLSILASAAETGIVAGISLNSSLLGPSAQSDISNVTIRGADGLNATKHFTYAVADNGFSNVNFINDQFVGSSNGAAYTPASLGTYGIYLAGNSTTTPVQFNIIGCQLNYWSYAINYGPYVQGISIGQSNFVGNSISVYLPDGSSSNNYNNGNDQLSVTGSQFNDANYNIFVGAQLDGLNVSGNLFYVYGNAVSGGTVGSSIYLKQAGQYAISGNSFVGLWPAGGSAPGGVTVGQWLLDSGVISGNQFKNFAAGVYLQSGSQHANVQSNSYSANSGNTLNNGTNNTVGGGSQ